MVEIHEPVNRTVLFDPGAMSTVDVDSLQFLDDIVITHEHGDHIDMDTIKKLAGKFPEVRILTTNAIVEQLKEQGITATTEPPEGMQLFTSPHENVEPLFPTPEQIGVHYLDKLSHPGDGLSFSETKEILALPVQAPWQKGTPVDAFQKAVELKPKYVIPIHDWHWRDEARESIYAGLEKALAKEGITFIKAKNGEAFILDV